MQGISVQFQLLFTVNYLFSYTNQRMYCASCIFAGHVGRMSYLVRSQVSMKRTRMLRSSPDGRSRNSIHITLTTDLLLSIVLYEPALVCINQMEGIIYLPWNFIIPKQHSSYLPSMTVCSPGSNFEVSLAQMKVAVWSKGSLTCLTAICQTEGIQEGVR